MSGAALRRHQKIMVPIIASSRLPLVSLAVLCAALPAAAQQTLLGRNLIVNGSAEAGPAAPGLSPVVTNIPNWTTTGGANVVSYDITGLILSTEPAPPDRGFNYFVSGPTNLGLTATLTQDIDVSSASEIASGNVKFTFQAYLGAAKGTGLQPPAQVAAAFKNAGGQVFSTITLGPTGYSGSGLSLQQQIGLVPAGTAKITIVITLTTRCLNAAQCGYGTADSLSLVLNTIGTPPRAVIGTNQIVNPSAEAGPAVAAPATAAYITGWSSANGASVAPYGGTGWIAPNDPGPPDRGINVFRGGLAGANIYQDLDVSAAATMIDAGQVTFNVSAWLGGLTSVQSPTLTYTFFDWSGKQLAPTAQIGPVAHSGISLVLDEHSDRLPAGTRRAHIVLTFPSGSSLADNITFTLSAPGGPPVITPGGIVSASAFGGFSNIAPGTWIEIFGANLAAKTQSWSGDGFHDGVAPTTLGDVTVSIGGKPAFIDYVSPGQVNALVPSDVPLGPVQITVKNPAGTSDGYGVAVDQTEPGLLAPASFTIGGKQYLAALFSDGQTFAIPQNAIPGVNSRAAKPGDVLTVYGIGFGPVTGGFQAGTLVTAQNALTTPLQFLFGATTATTSYAGLAPSFTGLYQFNIVVPNIVPNAAVPVTVSLGSTKGSQTLYIAIQN